MAKQCCVCKRKLGFLDSGFELDGKNPSYMLCSDCNLKRLDLRVAKSQEELNQKLIYFSELLNNSKTPAAVINGFRSMSNQGLRSAGAEAALKKREKEQMEKWFGEGGTGYTFSTEISIIGAHYETTVRVYRDRVEIKRSGKTDGIPAELTFYFKEITAVSWGSQSGRSWVTFTVPGASRSGNISAIMKGGVMIGGQETIPYRDPCSIVFALNQEEEAKRHYKIIKERFDIFRAQNMGSSGNITTIQQDSAVDKLKKLKELKDLGVLSDEEYEEKRQKLLAEI